MRMRKRMKKDMIFEKIKDMIFEKIKVMMYE